ncbi:MAG: protein kinase [Alphaproteobacteria bacterium]|jgi:serine/threonine-protein kinase|nr:protein kinase [Alphaproteobacteria bacterium]
MAQERRSESEGTPRTIGKYRIDSTLGHGAMGVVYKAYDTSIDRLVALKTIRADLLVGDEDLHWLERFQREARAAARCLHPNIVTIFEYGEDGGTPYICMEYVNGVQLQDYIAARAEIDVQACVKIVEKVLKALGYAHAQGIVHRDIKPSNIMLLDDGQVKVTDFGIARIDSITMTAHGSMVGTPSYMSPEQFIGGDLDRRSDIFSTGVILYELLTGQKPFPGKSITEVMYAVLNQPPRDPVDFNEDLGPLAPVVLKALARQPEDRFQTAAAFFSALSIAATGRASQIEDSGIGDGATIVSPSIHAARSRTPAPAQPAHSPGETLDDAAIAKAESDLTTFLGPVAKIMVRKTAGKVDTVSALYDSLAGHIASSADRALFLSKAAEPLTDSSAGKRRRDLRSMLGTVRATMETGFHASRSGATQASTSQAPVEEDIRERAKRDLMEFLGPIAQVLVRKAAAKTSSPPELYRLLAEHITNAQDRAAFLNRAPRG